MRLLVIAASDRNLLLGICTHLHSLLLLIRLELRPSSSRVSVPATCCRAISRTLILSLCLLSLQLFHEGVDGCIVLYALQVLHSIVVAASRCLCEDSKAIQLRVVSLLICWDSLKQTVRRSQERLLWLRFCLCKAPAPQLVTQQLIIF